MKRFKRFKLALDVTILFAYIYGLGAPICSFWVIYVAFQDAGLSSAILVFFWLSVTYKFGLAPMFAVAASLLSFYYGVVGTYLPYLSYGVAVVSLFATPWLVRECAISWAMSESKNEYDKT